MTARKIEAMHLLYGTSDGRCQDCPHFVEGMYHNRKYFKCMVYGLTHSESTDWRAKYAACGMKVLPFQYGEAPVIDRLKREIKRFTVAEQIEGQIGIDELIGGE